MELISFKLNANGNVDLLFEKTGGVPFGDVRNLGDDISDLPADAQTQINAHWADPDVQAAWALIVAASTPTLAETIASKINSVNAARDAKSQAGFATQGKTWASDLGSVGSIMAKWHRHSASPPVDTTWISTDNTTVTLAWADFKLLAGDLQDYLDALVNQARSHKDAIDALGTTTLVNDYDITIGWPATS